MKNNQHIDQSKLIIYFGNLEQIQLNNYNLVLKVFKCLKLVQSLQSFLIVSKEELIDNETVLSYFDSKMTSMKPTNIILIIICIITIFMINTSKAGSEKLFKYIINRSKMPYKSTYFYLLFSLLRYNIFFVFF